jgi:hypothetical protein
VKAIVSNHLSLAVTYFLRKPEGKKYGLVAGKVKKKVLWRLNRMGTSA